jgi:hypothetical protein
LTDRAQRLAAEVGGHRAALEAFIATAEGLSTDAWNARRSSDKWSPAQVSEHLRITYTTILAELAGRGGLRIRTKWWQRRLLRFLYLPRILKGGSFPKGVVAPREIRPGDGPFERRAVLTALREEGEAFIRTVSAGRIGNETVTHPYLGRLGLVDGVRFLTQHLRHHHAQIAGGDAGAVATAAPAAAV